MSAAAAISVAEAVIARKIGEVSPASSAAIVASDYGLAAVDVDKPGDLAQVRALVAGRVADAVAGGTTYLETKTGYGLSVEEETRHARLLAGLREPPRTAAPRRRWRPSPRRSSCQVPRCGSA